MDASLAEVSNEHLETELATLAARIAAATGRFLDLLGEMDRRGAWPEQNLPTLAHWLSWRVGMDLRTAHEHVRVAKALRELPQTALALRCGTISYSKARAITRVARPETEEKLLEMARNATAQQLEHIAGIWRRADTERERERAERHELGRYGDVYFDDDGMLVIRARLTPEEGALFMRAMDAARAALWKDGKSANGKAQRADQIALLADRSLSGERRVGSDRVMVMVHVDEQVLADPAADGQSRIEDGPECSAERLACDASTARVIHHPDGAITVGHRTRRIGAALRRALQVRDGGLCRFPGCANRIVDVHHIDHWARGGATTLSNLTLLCRRHHVLVHEGGYRVEMHAGEPLFFRPDGRPIRPAPPQQAHGALPAAADCLMPRNFVRRLDHSAIADTFPASF